LPPHDAGRPEAPAQNTGQALQLAQHAHGQEQNGAPLSALQSNQQNLKERLAAALKKKLADQIQENVVALQQQLQHLQQPKTKLVQPPVYHAENFAIVPPHHESTAVIQPQDMPQQPQQPMLQLQGKTKQL
jgi:hypothetical protein